MASTLDVVVATERLLTHHDRETHNRLAAAIDDTTETITLEFDGTGFEKDVQIAIGFELGRVWSRNGATVTAERGDAGSNPAAHSEGDRIIAKPKFPRAHILDAINDELDDLSSPARGLFRMKTLSDITYDSGVDGYNGAADIIEIHEASWEPVSSTKARRFFSPADIAVHHGLDTGDFTSGTAIFLPAGISDGYVVRVRYKGAFTSVAADTASVETTSGLPATAVDLLSIGAAIRLLAPLEPARNYTDAQGDSRRSDEVPPGAQARSVAALMQLKADRTHAEASRLRQLYPTRLR